ncbi:DUF3572 family protein [Paracoccus sp. M683]|uniref:DUF3572 family protein n=1 Tax=Paracoccus sp. M683 TaxID=2594268 RepID=UPI00117C5052|nr:DUF3572 family protein [Paracoccus sp. M683]TRW97755.1 DUF3572 family protein [Paracoccus sp. M683]
MLTESRAQAIAADALSFIAADGEMTAAMLAVSGLQVGDLRKAAEGPDFGIFLLDFILQDDQRVLAFAASQGVRPESVLHARDLLTHGGRPGAYED